MQLYGLFVLLVLSTCARTALNDGRYASTDAADDVMFDASNDSSGLPDALVLTGNTVAVVAGAGTACALTTDAAVWCWGDNLYGQLGSSVIPGSAVPSPVAGLPDNVVSIASGFAHVCAVTSDGRAHCWGLDESGQLGDGKSSSPHPVAVTIDLPTGIVMIAAGKITHAP